MKNPDGVKAGLTLPEREFLHGLLMQGMLWPGSEVPRVELPALLPGLIDVDDIVQGLISKGLCAVTHDAASVRVLVLGYEVGAQISEDDLVNPSAGLVMPLPPGWKWPVENPGNTPWNVNDEFLKDTSSLNRDGGLRSELLNAMASALADSAYGKPQRGPRAGQRNARVGRNFRLFWRREGREVIFLQFGSKEDPRIAPRGK